MKSKIVRKLTNNGNKGGKEFIVNENYTEKDKLLHCGLERFHSI